MQEALYVYEMQEGEGSGGNWRRAVTNADGSQPCKILLDIRVMHAMQSIVDVNKSDKSCPDGISTAGVSMLHGLVMRWHLRGLSFFAATCTVFRHEQLLRVISPKLLLRAECF
jgi:hypothetical protein